MTENVLVYDRENEERSKIIVLLRDSTAFASDATLKISEYDTEGKVRAFLAAESPLQLAVMEVCRKSDIILTKELRRSKEHVELMLVAESTISPMEYLTPDIRACSLLLRPYNEAQLSQVLRSFMLSYLDSLSSDNTEDVLKIEGREGIIRIAYKDICYIEVREKKIYIRLRDKEYSKYDSLDNISKKLPDYFMQTHRSYIVNTRLIEQIRISEKLIYLRNGIRVPLSRSYREAIKEIMNGGNKGVLLSE